MGWAQTTVIWVPTIAVSAMAVVACAGAFFLPERAAPRLYAFVAAVLLGGAAIAATVWQQREQIDAIDRQQAASATDAATVAGFAARLKGAWQRLDALDRLLPAVPDSAPGKAFDTVDAGFAALAADIDDLEKRVKAFREQEQARTIDDDTAAAMIEYLRSRGAHRVVLTCVPNDDEAYRYANRVATILRQAGWDAVGPQTTALFGDAPAMGISLYVHAGGQPPEVAHLLTDAFARFNIPYQSRIASNEAIPDNETVELFVGKKP